MLLVPFVTGAAAAGRNAKFGPVALLFLASLSLFWLRTPLGNRRIGSRCACAVGGELALSC